MPDPIVIQEISIQDAAEVNQLVSDAFGYKKPHQFFQDFPIWGSDQVKRFGIYKNSKLVSHVGMRFTRLGNQSVGLIGAVATDALHRAQGHSSALLTHAIDVAKGKNLDWLVLWGSEHDFYAKFGFELAGIQTRIRVSDYLRQQAQATLQFKVKTGYNPKIFDVLKKQNSVNNIILTDADRPWFERHDTVQWLWTADPFAFIGFERGMDLPHFIHEWAGAREALPSLFEQIARQDPNAEILLHPSQMASLGAAPEIPHINERLCIAKPLKGQVEWPEEFWISGLNAC